MRNYSEVLALWGSGPAAYAELAAATGATDEQVRKWYVRQSIPPGWWMQVCAAAERRGHALTTDTLATIAARERQRTRA